MKARPFLALVLAGVLALLSLGLGSWWWVVRRSPLHLQHQSLAVPLASRFVPRQAPLTLHLLTAPDQLEGYARAVTPGRQRRQAAEVLARLRDGAFAVAGLDYSQELAGWIGDQTSLSLFSPDPGAGSTGWVLALRSRDPEGARRFLQRFWQSRSLAGTDLQVSTYRGMGLISGRGALVGQESRPLATALIDDDLVLIASGRGVLEQALDVSQIDELNQAADPKFQKALERLGEGAALITARPEGLVAWLGLPAGPAIEAARPDLVLSLRPDGRTVVLDGLVALAKPLPPLQSAAAVDLSGALRAGPSSLALLQDPAQLLGPVPAPERSAVSSAAAEMRAASPEPAPASPEPRPEPLQTPPQTMAWAELLAPTLQALLQSEAGPLPALVAAADHGPLLWSHLASGWLLGTAADAVPSEALDAPLEAQGYAAAPLSVGDRSVQAWARLVISPRKGESEHLEAGLAGVRLVQGPVAWWAQGLAGLESQVAERGKAADRDRADRLSQLQALDSPEAPVRLVLAARPAQELLLRWQPWRLLGTLAGGSLRQSVQGLAMSLEPETAPVAEDGLHLRARLDLT